MRTKEAVKLHNWRNTDNQIKMHDVAKLLFPDATKNYVNVTAFRLNRNEFKLINPDWVIKVSDFTGVDANFLFGMESIHDKDFNKL